jgi:GT2 family glycosyltransferase
MLDISVIIVTRNTCTLTCAAIESVRNSRDDLRKEIILVDNGSIDDTKGVVTHRFPSVRYLYSATNLGFARANNWGSREAQGRCLLLLNSDAAVKPDTLSLAMAWMDLHPDCGVAGAQLLNPDGSRQNSIANSPTLATELLNKSLLRRLWSRKYPGKECEFTKPVAVESIVGAFMLIRRETWDAIGGLDERYFFFLEETDFCLQTRRRGWQVTHLPHLLVWHGQGRSTKAISAAARIEYWRSRYIYFAKNHGSGTRALLAIGLTLRLAVDWLVSGLLSAAMFGVNVGWNNKWQVCSALAYWHARGKPHDMGLPR